jgi:hypothetical protein
MALRQRRRRKHDHRADDRSDRRLSAFRAHDNAGDCEQRWSSFHAGGTR